MMKAWSSVLIVAALAGGCAHGAPVLATRGGPSSADANAASDEITLVAFSDAMFANTTRSTSDDITLVAFSKLMVEPTSSDGRDAQPELSFANTRLTAFEPASEPSFRGME